MIITWWDGYTFEFDAEAHKSQWGSEHTQGDLDYLWPYCRERGVTCPVCQLTKALGSQFAHLVQEVRPHTLIAPGGLVTILEAYYENLFDDRRALYVKTYGDGKTINFSGE